MSVYHCNFTLDISNARHLKPFFTGPQQVRENGVAFHLAKISGLKFQELSVSDGNAFSIQTQGFNFSFKHTAEESKMDVVKIL